MFSSEYEAEARLDGVKSTHLCRNLRKMILTFPLVVVVGAQVDDVGIGNLRLGRCGAGDVLLGFAPQVS